MDQTQILMELAKGAYLFDNGDIELHAADGTIMKISDDYGREIDARFPYMIIEGLLRQRYIEQDKNDARIYRISRAGLRALQS
jgi:hypothetical protein